MIERKFKATGEVKIEGCGKRIFDFTDFQFDLEAALKKSCLQWYVRCGQEDMERFLENCGS